MENYDFKSANSFEFEMKDMGKMTFNNPEITDIPHRANFNQIVLLKTQKTVQEVDFRKFELNGLN